MDDDLQPLVETENYAVFRSVDDEGEVVYHVEMFNVTLHFFQDEWREFVALISEAADEE